MPNEIWCYSTNPTEVPNNSILTSYLSEAKRLFNNSPIVEDLLIKRSYLTNLTKEPKVEEYFQQDYKDMYQQGLNIILQHIKNKKKIIVFGDFDVDGITATTSLYSCIKEVYKNVDWYVPSRLEEGYGLNTEAVASKAEPGSLIITVDNGIANVEEVDQLNKLGYHILITDHHTPDMEKLPQALHIINPKLYKEEEIGDEWEAPGVFVSAKLGYLLLHHKNHLNRNLIRNIITFCGLGIVSDIIKLNPMMRKTLWTALSYLQCTTHDGLKALLHMCNVRENQPITSTFLAFNVVPKLNAAGRMNSANSAVELLLMDIDSSINKTTSLLAANGLKFLNADRKIIEATIFLEAKQLVENEKEKYENSIVVYKSGWHSGVLGIIAARLVEVYNKPTLVLTDEKGTIRGSGRSVLNFDLYKGLEECSNLLVRFGGHTAACGVELVKDNLQAFKDKFETVVRDANVKKDVEIFIDGDVSVLNLYDVRFHMFLQIFEPYGRGNPQLVLRLKDMKITKSEEVKDVLHLYLEDKAGFTLKVTKYKAPKEWLHIDENIDLLVTPNFTYFTGTTIPDFRILSIKLTSTLK